MRQDGDDSSKMGLDLPRRLEGMDNRRDELDRSSLSLFHLVETMTHKKRLRKTEKKLDALKKKSVKSYKRKEKALNHALSRLKL